MFREDILCIILMRLLVFVLGSYYASFINCVLPRYMRGEDWVSKPSHCEKCEHVLAWWENIPVMSCVLLHGRCVECGGYFGYYHAGTEMLLGLCLMNTYNIICDIVRLGMWLSVECILFAIITYARVSCKL